MRIAKFCVVPAVLSIIGACDLLGEQIDVLDAARIYDENPEAFERVRQQFPGPFAEAHRIPAFDDADNRPENIKFLEDLQQSIPVEILQFYTWGEGGPDVIKVVRSEEHTSELQSLMRI